MLDTVMPWIQWLQDQPVTTSWRESAWGYPAIETSHVVSIIMFAGFVVMMDLRLVGAAFRQTPFSYIQSRLFPLQMVGMAFSSITGMMLLVIDPIRFYDNVFFWAKVVMLIVAGRERDRLSPDHVQVGRRVGSRRARAVPRQDGRRGLAGALVGHHRLGPPHRVQLVPVGVR